MLTIRTVLATAVVCLLAVCTLSYAAPAPLVGSAVQYERDANGQEKMTLLNDLPDTSNLNEDELLKGLVSGKAEPSVSPPDIPSRNSPSAVKTLDIPPPADDDASQQFNSETTADPTVQMDRLIRRKNDVGSVSAAQKLQEQETEQREARANAALRSGTKEQLEHIDNELRDAAARGGFVSATVPNV